LRTFFSIQGLSPPRPGDEFEIESRIPGEVKRALGERGHKVIVSKDWDPWFGVVQAVSIDAATGALYGGADPRREGPQRASAGAKRSPKNRR